LDTLIIDPQFFTQPRKTIAIDPQINISTVSAFLANPVADPQDFNQPHVKLALLPEGIWSAVSLRIPKIVQITVCTSLKFTRSRVWLFRVLKSN